MKRIHGKLVRDNIVDSLENRGLRCKARTVPKDELKQHLLLKLIEEAHECHRARPNDLDEELADLLEVINALIEITPGLTLEHVTAIRAQKRKLKGGFKLGIYLISTEGTE